MRDLATNCSRVRDATTGVVFLGTPHTDTNSEALLQVVKNNVQLLRHDFHVVEDEDIRHFASALATINSTFINTKPTALQSISFWEEEPSMWTSAGGEECSKLVSSMSPSPAPEAHTTSGRSKELSERQSVE